MRRRTRRRWPIILLSRRRATRLRKQILANGEHQDQATIEKMNAHRQKLRQAMLKEDPTLKPIFAEIDKHISEVKAKQLGQLQNSGASGAPSSH